MAKGQLRSNREVKKPKQSKKPTPISSSSPSRAVPVKESPRAEAEKKR